MCKSREGTEPLLRARWGPEASARLLCQRNSGCLCASPENPQAWASPWGTFHFCMSLLLLPAPHFHPKAFKVILTCREKNGSLHPQPLRIQAAASAASAHTHAHGVFLLLLCLPLPAVLIKDLDFSC